MITTHLSCTRVTLQSHWFQDIISLTSLFILSMRIDGLQSVHWDANGVTWPQMLVKLTIEASFCYRVLQHGGIDITCKRCYFYLFLGLLVSPLASTIHTLTPMSVRYWRSRLGCIDFLMLPRKKVTVRTPFLRISQKRKRNKLLYSADFKTFEIKMLWKTTDCFYFISHFCNDLPIDVPN